MDRTVIRETTGSGWAPGREWLQPEADEYERHLGWLYLALMTVLAALLRLFQLGHQSLWVDEILTWRGCRPDQGLEFWTQILDTFQGPLYLAVLWPLVRVDGAELMLRLPAVLAGIATVPLFALTAERLFDTRTARLSALLLAVSPFHIWYSQEARGYAFVIFFSVASSLLFLMMAERGPRGRTVLGYILLMACAVWSNMSALFLWAAHGLALLVVVRPRTARAWLLWLVALAGVLLVVMPWTLKATGIWAVERLAVGGETGVALRGETTFTPVALLFTVFTFFYGYSLGPSLRELHQPDRLAMLTSYWPLLTVAGGVATAALMSGLVRLRRGRWSLLIWIGLPVLAVTILAWRNVKPFNPRYLAVVFPWVLLLATAGLLAFSRWWGQWLTIVLSVLFLWSAAGYHFEPRFGKADLRGATAYVTAHEADGDLILVPVVTGVFRYYYQGRNEIADSFGSGVLQTEEQVHAFLSARVGDAQHCWVILARSWYFDPHDWLPQILAREGEILCEERFTGVRLYSWEPMRREGVTHEP